MPVSFKSFMVPGHTYKSVINFELIFASGIRYESNLIVFKCVYPVFTITLLKRLSLTH